MSEEHQNILNTSFTRDNVRVKQLLMKADIWVEIVETGDVVGVDVECVSDNPELSLVARIQTKTEEDQDELHHQVERGMTMLQTLSNSHLSFCQ